MICTKMLLKAVPIPLDDSTEEICCVPMCLELENILVITACPVSLALTSGAFLTKFDALCASIDTVLQWLPFPQDRLIVLGDFNLSKIIRVFRYS